MGRRMLWETDYLSDWSRRDGVTLSRALTEADVSPRWLWDRMLAFGGLGPSRGDFGSWLVAQSQLLPRKVSQAQKAASAFAPDHVEATAVTIAQPDQTASEPAAVYLFFTILLLIIKSICISFVLKLGSDRP